jgi:pimeloyl-ACP methyl ester carboxylesterase/DNA-binding winged helix-turn-helix (wHTH) protein
VKGTLLFGPFRLDTAGRRLWRGTEVIPLAPKSFDLLEHLAENQGQLKTRDELFAALWPDTIVDDHALSVQIREIRKALGDDAYHPTYIETRHRRGYCFRAQVSRVAHTAASGASLSSNLTAAASPHTGVLELPGVAAAVQQVPRTRYALSGDVNIAYQVVGDGPVDLVFVMGWISHLEYFWTEPRFARFLRRLASFSRVILFDKRGTGLSDSVPVDQLPTIEQRMEDLHAVMQAAGSERAVICGISDGGCMSAVFAATYPERTLALVMIGTFARRLRSADHPWGPDAEQRESFLREIQEHWGGPVGLAERAPTLASDPEFRRWWAAYLRMGASPGAAVALTRMSSEVDIRHVLPAVRVPTLVLHRTGDMCLKLEEGRYVASLIPDATFVALPGVDHLPFVGDQDSILNKVESFVSALQHDRAHDRSLATVLALRFSGASDSSAQVPSEALHRELVACLRPFSATVSICGRTEILAAFEGPARAVRAARAVSTVAQRQGMDSSAGVHTGECMVGAPDTLRGSAVEVAQRVRDLAAPGEILVTGTVRDLVAGSGLEFDPRGRTEAAGLGEWQLLRLRNLAPLVSKS